jgi:proteasome lid subunit RPN8/RPN11
VKYKHLESEIKEYARSKLPEEACGLIVQDGANLVFIPCENIAENKRNNFKISNETMLKYSGRIESIFHSHIEQGTWAVSLSDIKLCEAWGVEGTILFYSAIDNNVESDLLSYGTAPIDVKLQGRPYIYNLYDCFTVIRDFYHQEMNIPLDFVYSDYGWWGEGNYDSSLYLREYERLGFYEFDISQELQKGDILIMKLGRSSCLNHGAIYTGGNSIIHHLEGKLSCKEALARYSSRIERGVRHHASKN